MARANKPCGHWGCPNVSHNAYCPEHEPERPHGWDTSTRRKPKNWDRIRGRVLRRDRYRCVICGRKADFVDHFYPMAWGGNPTSMSNLRAMCGRCHHAKTDDEKRLGKRYAPFGPPDSALALFFDAWMVS